SITYFTNSDYEKESEIFMFGENLIVINKIYFTTSKGTFQSVDFKNYNSSFKFKVYKGKIILKFYYSISNFLSGIYILEPLKTPILFLKTPPKPISATKPQKPSGRASTELRFLGVRIIDMK
ncbi:MAG: hypothetical protein EAZ27_00560, partial [Cytophagales bacterium]